MNLALTSKAPHEEEYKMVGLLVDRVRYGVNIMKIREIINPGEYVQMPALPPYVIGVADHREAVIPIIDLRIRFGIPSTNRSRRSKWILVRMEEREVGLQVDQVTQVLKVRQENHRDKNSLLTEKEEVWIKNVFSDNDGLIFELDLESLIRPDIERLETEPFRSYKRDES